MIVRETWQRGNPDEPKGAALIYFDGDIRGVSINLLNGEQRTQPLAEIDQDTLAELVEDADRDGFDVIRLGESRDYDTAYVECALTAAADCYRREYFTAVTQSLEGPRQPKRTDYRVTQ